MGRRKRTVASIDDLTKYCHGYSYPKRRHETKEAAQKAMGPIYAAAKRKDRKGKRPGVFHCPWCSSWHIGRK
jgi:hypothetical protein